MSRAAALHTLIVTRPQPQADEWVAALQAQGQPAVALPLLCIEDDPRFEPAVQDAWRSLPQTALVMFVSPNAVARFFAAAPGLGWPGGVPAAATGPGTVAALNHAGVAAADILAPDPTADRFDAETLWQQRLSKRDWTGRQVLIVRGETGRDWLADTLARAGALVRIVSAYRSAPAPWDAPAAHLVAECTRSPAGHVWLFSSSKAIEHLTRWLGPGRRGAALATHPRIAATARAAGFTPVIDTRPDRDAILAALRSLAP